jgi:hypothetical protein
LAEQLRRRFAKPQRLVRFQHGIPTFALRASARRAISSIISVERYTPCGRAPALSKPEYRACYFWWPCANTSSISRHASTGVGQDFTGLVAAVQLRLRVAFFFGLQALQRCSGLLNRRARGSTVATHHFADVAQERQQQFRKLPGTFAPRECSWPRANALSIGSIWREERQIEK